MITWTKELEYCRSIDKANPGSDFNNRVETFARYLLLQSTEAILQGAYTIGRDIRNIYDEVLYLDWVNNFLTVEAFAEHYNIWPELARNIIETQKHKEG